MTTLSYPRPPTPAGLQLAQEILKKRFMADHKDYNRMTSMLRERGLDHGLAFYGECSRDAIPVIDAAALLNLQSASIFSIERKIKALEGQVGSSLAGSMARVDINRLGGSGAAGRQRDQSRDSERRNITRMHIERLRRELQRRKLQDQTTHEKDVL